MTDAPGPVFLLTRESEDNRAVRAAVEARGLPVREIPCVATQYYRPAVLPRPGFASVTFSSRRGVRGVVRHGLSGELIETDPRPLVAAVGPATASELADSGIRADIVADPPGGEVLAPLMAERLTPGSRIVMVRGTLRVNGMDQILTQAGFKLEPMLVYENIDPGVPGLDPFPVAAVLVASPSAARRLVEKNPWIKEHRFAAVGPTTAKALTGLGVESIHELGPDSSRWPEALISIGSS